MIISWFCKHSWKIILATYCSPTKDFVGRTFVLLECSKCGNLKNEMMLGKTKLTIKIKK